MTLHILLPFFGFYISLRNFSMLWEKEWFVKMWDRCLHVHYPSVVESHKICDSSASGPMLCILMDLCGGVQLLFEKHSTQWCICFSESFILLLQDEILRQDFTHTFIFKNSSYHLQFTSIKFYQSTRSRAWCQCMMRVTWQKSLFGNLNIWALSILSLIGKG